MNVTKSVYIAFVTTVYNKDIQGLMCKANEKLAISRKVNKLDERFHVKCSLSDK